jgi:HEAT repeat protein
MRQFIVDGYLILDSGLPPEFHARVYNRIDTVLKNSGNPGNNILPAVPEMHQVLDSPRIRGALTAVLGHNYVLHPHRYVHNNEPAEKTDEGLRIGRGSHSFVGWHQDDHSPLSRARHHFCRFAMILYYPQDTPIEMGPTQIIPGTHRSRTISDRDRERGFQAAGPAGTCVLVHFDLAHGGSLNVSNRTRFMAKFVFARTEEPTEPTWDCHHPVWQCPPAGHVADDLEIVWRAQWDWHCGRTNGTAHRPAHPAGMSQDEVAEAAALLIRTMGEAEPARQNAIYMLAQLGAPAIPLLVDELLCGPTSGWSESATVMENATYALAAMGEPAVGSLTRLLSHEDEWVRINAIFALGEIGKAARPAIEMLCAALQDPSYAVVRTALDAIGHIGGDPAQIVPAIEAVLTRSDPEWQTPIERNWSAQDQVRINAVMALVRLGYPEAIPLVAGILDDPCGYVGGFGIEYLLRQGTPESLEAASEYLYRHRWDNTLQSGIRTY